MAKSGLGVIAIAGLALLGRHWPARVLPKEPHSRNTTIAAPAAEFPAAACVDEDPWRRKLDQLWDEPADSARGERLVGLSCQIPASEISSVLASLSEEELGSDFGISLFQRAVAAHPLWALQWAAQVQDGKIRDHLFDLALAAAVERESEATLRWWSSLPESDGKKSLQVSLAYALLGHRPIDALELALGVRDSSLSTGEALAQKAMSAWASQDPLKAKEWLDNLADPRFREKLAASVARGWAETESGKALTFLLESVSPGQEQENALLAILQRDPRGVNRWMSALSREQIARLSDHSLYILWAASDPIAATDWAARMEGGRARDEVFATSVIFLARRDPGLAGDLAQAIDDPLLAESSQERVRISLQ